MSKLDKLQITGVRSFNHERGEIIKFYSPLTLIVGSNGSGKTTIIEALRYATTGELPPGSSQGGAWIRDPKLCGENEVLAQVKLSFNSTSGVKMVVNRNIQVTMKAKSRVQKTLDATLKLSNAGERTAISSRVAELDQIMPQYLGVSNAVLESVIFCHQDDSLWPMSAPAGLKKKFDEIFEAQKYTKAVDNIVVIRKTQKAELEKYILVEQHAKSDNDRAERADAKSRELHKQIDELRLEREQVAEEQKDAFEKSRVAFDHAAKFEKIVSELAGKRIEAQATDKSIQTLKLHMKVMDDSDEALRDMQDKYEGRLVIQKRESEVQRAHYIDLANELDTSRKQLGVTQSEVGRHQAQKDHFEHQISSRRDLIKETARRHDIRGFDSDITDEHVREFMQRIGKLARDQTNAFERARRENQEEAQKTQQLLNSLNERRSALQQTKTNAAGFMQSNDSKIYRFQTELNKIDIDEGGKTVLESEIDDLERRLSKGKKDFESANWDSRIQSTDGSLVLLEQRKDRLDSELMEASRHAKDSARLDFLRKELKDRQQSLATMSGAHGPRIATVLGAEWVPSTLERQFQDVVAEKSSAVKDAELQRDGTSRELEQVHYRLSSTSTELKQKRQLLKENERVVRDTLRKLPDGGTAEPSEYPTQLEVWEQDLSQLKQDTAFSVHLEGYYGKCLDTATKHNICQLCIRPFKNDEVRTKFVTSVKEKVRKAKETIEAEAVEESEERVAALKRIGPNHDTLIRLQGEIPELEKQRKGLEPQRDDLNAKLENQDQVVKERGEVERDVESLNKTVQNMHRYHIEIGNFESQMQNLLSLQKDAGLSRSLDQIQDEQKKLSEEIRSVNLQLQQFRADKERSRALVNTLELEIRDAKARLTTAVHHLKEKTNLQNQINDIKAQNVEQRDTTKCADQDIQALMPQIAQAQTTLDDIRLRGEERNKALQKTASKLSDSHRQLQLADEEIGAYIDKGGSQQLTRAMKEISNLQDDIARIEGDQRKITVEIKKIEDDLRSQSETKRAITDNLTYRESVKHLQNLKDQMAELGDHNAEADKERYEREAGKWQNERNKLSAKQASLVGQVKSKDDQLNQLLLEFETDYKDAAEKFREAKTRVAVTRAGIDDLARYGGALDKAIMKYHSMKMEEINKIIDELWRETYQGTDVDTVMIRSENETQKGNKSYNYRVVMIKQDAEMDMRGRCSAGQKVLASIIIRLALAECFGVRCGLIALDEPTTNLDRDNIQALAESLANIIRIRKQQANFQLIIITHDEEFLRFMNCSDFCDYYYRVDRADDQCSRIRQQKIQDVM